MEFGDAGALADLVESAAREGADAIALSPTHSLFAADPSHFGPYSPSSRLFLNPLFADPALVFGAARVAAAHDRQGRHARRADRLAGRGARKIRTCCAGCSTTSSRTAAPLAADFAVFRARRRRSAARARAVRGAASALVRRAGAEMALERLARRLARADGAGAGSLRRGREPGDPNSTCSCNGSRRAASRACSSGARDAGMRIGLIADLAIGMNPGGSHAWSRQQDLLLGLNVGAPPDLFNTRGQDWGLTGFSPQALVDERLRAVHRDLARRHGACRRRAHRSRDGPGAPLARSAGRVRAGRRLSRLSGR